MTANDLIRNLQKAVSGFTTGDIPLKLEGKELNGFEEFVSKDKDGYYININPIYSHE